MQTSIEQTLAALTLEEKAALLMGRDFWHTVDVPRLGIGSITVSDGPHGMRVQPEHGDHAGIGGSLPATCFPTASALGSSWDAELIRGVGEALGREARAQGVAVVLGPGINIKRSPLCGRNFEYFSEDPLLSGVLGAAAVQGLQREGVGACVKHFAANNQETDRLRVSAEVDERALREIYLPAFERVVREANPWTVMCAYNKLNGVSASENEWLLTQVLREEWGFEGAVISDWGAVGDRVAAVAAGLDLEMPPNHGVSNKAIVKAVRDGVLDEAVVDRSVARMLRLVEQAGPSAPPGDFDTVAHHEIARNAATECAVLLKNDGGILPLAPQPGETVAVIGEFARSPRYQGAGSSQVSPTKVDVALDSLRARVPEGVLVEFAPGFGLETTDEDDRLAEEAVSLAGRATTVLLFLGLPVAAESEGFDRTTMDLPKNQVDLVPRLARVNPRLLVVLANGSAVTLSDWDNHAAAVLETWLSGQASGSATADLLLGFASPSGRLAETIPLRLEDTPSFLNFPGEEGVVRYGESIFVGYRGFDARRQEVSYPFGHGLSYTQFEYGELAVSSGDADAEHEPAIEVSCRVANVGDRPAKEVVQLYLSAPATGVARPRELKAFSKVFLPSGQSEQIHFRLEGRDLAFWSTVSHDWVVVGGDYTVELGASSRDIRLRRHVTVPAPPPVTVPLTANASLDEWLADPVGCYLILQEVERDLQGSPVGVVGDAALRKIIGNFPLARLAAFDGLGITPEMVERVVNEAMRRTD